MQYKVAIAVVMAWLWLIAASSAPVALRPPANPNPADLMQYILTFVAFALFLGGIPVAGWIWLRDARGHEVFRARKRGGLCVHCGYDIHGNSRRCPECGKWTVRNAHRQSPAPLSPWEEPETPAPAETESTPLSVSYHGRLARADGAESTTSDPPAIENSESPSPIELPIPELSVVEIEDATDPETTKMAE